MISRLLLCSRVVGVCCRLSCSLLVLFRVRICVVLVEVVGVLVFVVWNG